MRTEEATNPYPSAAENSNSEELNRNSMYNGRDNPETGLPMQRKMPKKEREEKTQHIEEATRNADKKKRQHSKTKHSEEGKCETTGRRQDEKKTNTKGEEHPEHKRRNNTEGTEGEGFYWQGRIPAIVRRGGEHRNMEAKKRRNTPAEKAEERKRDEQRKRK